MKKIFSIVLFLSSLTFFGACGNNNTGSGAKSNSVKETISIDEFEKKLSQTTNAQLVDVRTPEEYAGGHLANAVNMDIKSENYKDQFSKLDKSKPVFVYCLAGARSAKAATIMQEMGFTEVYNMDGGINKWRNAGKPLVGIPPSLPTGITLEAFNKMIGQSNCVLVDYNAKWCEPCKKMLPIIESFAAKKKDKLSLLKIDADENKGLMKAKNIEAIPYLELYKNGQLVWSHNGYIEEDQLAKEINL